jgi:predicted ATPase
LQQARKVGEELLQLAQRQNDPVLLVEAYASLGSTLYFLGEFIAARTHLEQGITLYDLQRHRVQAFRSGQDPGVSCLSYVSWVLWVLGYPDLALQRSREARTLAQQLMHPFSLAFALSWAGDLHRLLCESYVVQELSEAVMTLASAQGFSFFISAQLFKQGWALVVQGQVQEGITQIRRGLDAATAADIRLQMPKRLLYLAEAYGYGSQTDAGFPLLAEALVLVNQTGERHYEAEIYRIKGELFLRHPVPDATQAQACFHQALAIARHQQAKSWELRAATSLARLWQHQGKRVEAHELLASVYGWFTEGFDTADLQEARVLLEELEG